MDGDGAGCVCGLGDFDEDDFGRFCETMSVYLFERLNLTVEVIGHTDRIFGAKHQLEPEGLVLVERIRVEDANVHEPLLKVVGLDYFDAGR